MKMNILFINADFFYYDRAIENQFRKNGHIVDSYLYKKPARFYEYYISRIVKKTPNQIALNRMQKKIIDSVQKKSIKYDVVLVTSGQELNTDTLSKLRSMYSNATFVWYLWDNICNIETFDLLKVYYDKIVSFDDEEAKLYGYYSLNNFYIKEDGEIDNKKYDLSYVGTYDDRRFRIVSEIVSKLPGYRVSINMFEYRARGIRATLNWIISKDKRDTSWLVKKKVGYDEYINLIKDSKCILDISCDNQTGLSMRIYEALAYRTKIITTNKSVLTKDFYNSQNIFYINPQNISVPNKQFFDTEYEDIKEEIRNRYSIENWCRDMERIIII